MVSSRNIWVRRIDLNQEISRIYIENLRLLERVDKIVYYTRIQNYDLALRNSVDITYILEQYIESLVSQTTYFSQRGLDLSLELIVDVLSMLVDIQQSRDYILLADIYESRLQPLIRDIQSIIVMSEELDESPNKSESWDMIESYNKDIMKQLRTRDEDEIEKRGYGIEATQSGHMNLFIQTAASRYYYHSIINPTYEALQLARSWYGEGSNHIIVFGLAMGYHIDQLALLNDNLEIDVYESSLDIIYLATSYGGIRYLKDGRIRIHYDPTYQKLVQALTEKEHETPFYIHYPSLKHVEDERMKEKLENYFVQTSSIQNQGHILKSNFSSNSKLVDGYVDDLHEEFQGKDLYIIAAGPSLDQNIHLLKDIPKKKSLILATGTVYRKLMKAGITPDYVIIADANARVVHQIDGLHQETIPLLLLSTAYHGFAKKYAGKKYMICQEGFEAAEEVALRKGLHQFQTGGSVSTTALDIGIALGAKNIIFLGLDLAYTNNYAHASDTSLREVQVTDYLRKVEDIYGNTILTTKSLDMYRQWIENRITTEKSIEFIDATEGGAKIRGMKIMSLKEVLSKTESHS